MTTYFLVSLLFWYVGLIPDLAVLRDQTTSRLKQFLYGIFALGWRGSVRHWEHYQVVYLLLAGLATALVVSVHSVVSLDFTASIVPGWHSTIFPPYFVAGAIFSGFAMVLTIAVPLRTYFGFKHLITEAHLDKAAKLILVTGLIVAYSYVMEGFTAWYSNSSFEKFTWVNRALGPYAPLFWLLLVCNVALPQFFWSAKCRKNGAILLSVSLGIQLGMWAERFVIIVTSLHRNVMPSRWGMYYPTVWDWGALLGSIGLFGFAFLLFLAGCLGGEILQRHPRKHQVETVALRQFRERYVFEADILYLSVFNPLGGAIQHGLVCIHAKEIAIRVRIPGKSVQCSDRNQSSIPLQNSPVGAKRRSGFLNRISFAS